MGIFQTSGCRAFPVVSEWDKGDKRDERGTRHIDKQCKTSK
jgi:hypothetical protein